MTEPMTFKATDWSFKLLPYALQQLNITPNAVIHIGAHWGQEVPMYLSCGFSWVTLVEPDPDACAKIKAQPWYSPDQVTLLQMAIAPEEGTAEFYQLGAGNGVWNGLKLNPDRGAVANIINVPTTRISTLQRNFKANVLVVDTQGTELEALATATLEPLDLIIVETQVDGVDGVHPVALHDWANQHGWTWTMIWDRTGGWTDTLLVPSRDT